MMAKNLEHQFSMLVREIRKEYVGNGPKKLILALWETGPLVK